MSLSKKSTPPSLPPPPLKGNRTGAKPISAGVSKRISDELMALLESDDFSVGEYLNKALSEGDNLDASVEKDSIDVERLMAKVALQLQLETQSCHDEIGRIGAELQAILPRCDADINRLAVGLGGMKQDTQALVENFPTPNQASPLISIDPNSANENTPGETMNTLSTLHALQLNLQFTKTILEATSSWDTTMSSIPSLLTNQKLSEAVTALSNLQQGARALRGMPGKEQREETILKFKTQIETLLKPQLLHAFANIETRINLLLQSHHMYEQLGNLDNFMFEYVKNRPANVHKGWFAFTPTLSSTNGQEDDNQVAKSEENSFIKFLPQWYKSIIALLNEERRRTQTVFGNHAAPIVTVKILAETFRPIIASFKSRLASIYSPEVQSNPSSPEEMNESSPLSYAGSLQTICDAYEATLHFLCLAYDHIANNNNSDTESSLAFEEIPHSQLARNIYIELTSPFSLYQKELSLLEFQHSSLQLSKIAKEFHAGVRVSTRSSVGTVSLLHLQGSIEKLEQLAPSVFSILNGALARFELLNCWHNSSEALSTIDKLLSNHASELSIAVSTLSTSMVGDDHRLADTFDEQHVQYALEVLKIVGNFKEEMKKFETETRKKLHAMIPKIKALQSTDIFKADSISPGEISILLATSVCCSNGTPDNSEKRVSMVTTLNQLHHLSGTSSGSKADPTFINAPALLTNSYDATTRLAHSCHTFVFDICTAVPQKYLSSVSNLPIWQETVKSSESPSDAGYGMSTSILPQTYITQVGEHMLALVQALEPFASSSEALYKANQIMGEEMKQVAKQPWRELMNATTLHTGKPLGITTVDSLLTLLMNGRRFDSSLGNTWKEFDENFPTCPHIDDEEEDGDEDEAQKASTAFCNEWLDVFCTAVTGRILERILRILRLTDLGRQHLATDLNYIINVFTALGISGHPHPLLKHFENLVSMDKDDLTARVALARSVKNDKSKKIIDLDTLLWGAEERIASMRDALP